MREADPTGTARNPKPCNYKGFLASAGSLVRRQVLFPPQNQLVGVTNDEPTRNGAAAVTQRNK